ncbi:MAG: hypothetical protein U9Q73_00350 [Nanoarchaeota archaeon]|nr:hypothetical protein [Nanoarchaeota archaeon]
MKCKRGYKQRGGKCVKTKRTIKQQKFKNKWITIALFFCSSLVVLVNNATDLFAKFGLFVPVQWVGWGGMILTMFYTWWLASEDKI